MARKPSAAQLRARRLFAARYGGKRSKPKSRRNPTRMARRRSSRKSSFRGVARGINQNAMLDGALAGAAVPIAASYIGPRYGPAVGLAAVGIFRKSATIQTLAGLAIGNTLAQGIQLPGANSVSMPAGVL